MSQSLNSLKGISQGSIIGVVKGDARSLDYSSYTSLYKMFPYFPVRTQDLDACR